MVLLFYFILQNNIKTTILTFMNVDELLFWQKPAGTRKTSVLHFIDTRFINDSDEFGKMFVARIALANAFKKTNTN